MTTEPLAQLPGMEDPPDEKDVRQLVDTFGRKEAIVLGWSKAKAKTVLEGLQREKALLEFRTATRAGQDEAGLVKPRPVMDGVRRDAADYLEQAIARGPVEVALALSWAVLDLQDDEQKRLAGWLVKLLRGQA
jgi:hypothetical protein